MAPTDLNLKKSWNPKLLKNREKVWQREREIYDQYKKAQQHNSKLNELHEKNELLALANKDQNKEITKNKKTGWMYQNPNTTNDGSTSKLDDDVLLGKRRLNDAISTTDNNSNNMKTSRLDKILKIDESQGNSKPNVNSETSNTLSKSDPLYAIKLQQIKRKEMIEKQKKINKYQTRAEDKQRSGIHRDRDDHHHRKSKEHRHRHHGDKYRDNERDRDPERKGTHYRDRK